MGSSFGQAFRLATFGESHGGGVGVVVDGCPPRLPLELADVQRDLDRRKPGQSRLTTPRAEADAVEILSGVFEGHTLGTPIAMLVRNRDARPSAYEHTPTILPVSIRLISLRRMRSGSRRGFSNRLKGQAPMQISQPKTILSTAPRRFSGIEPRFSIVR